MTKLLVSASVNGFGVEFGQNVIATRLNGGAGRYRLDKIGSAHDIDVQWVLEAQAYNYLMAFFRTEIAFGSLPFTIDLKAVDGAELGTYTARFKPGTLRMTGYLGTLYQVSASLEVTPSAVNKANDQALITRGPGQ